MISCGRMYITEKEERVCGMRRMVVYSEKCTGCKACMLECAAFHDRRFSISDARIRIEQEKSRWLFSPKVCIQCDEHPCIDACQFNALKRDHTSGVIRVESDSCTSCGLCVDACPYGGITLHPVLQKPLVCDLCDGIPQCIEVCLPGAIALEEV